VEKNKREHQLLKRKQLVEQLLEEINQLQEELLLDQPLEARSKCNNYGDHRKCFTVFANNGVGSTAAC
jgi:hypothetical protein